MNGSVKPHVKVKNLHVHSLATEIKNIATMRAITAPLLEILSTTMNVDAITFSSINATFEVTAGLVIFH